MGCEFDNKFPPGNSINHTYNYSDGLHGSFNWNSEQTLMTFHPDSGLIDSMMYSICLSEGMEMRENDGSMMMSGMSSYGSSVTGGVISKFETEK